MVVAGDAPGARLRPGTVLRIMTGAPVPEGADRVVPVERTEVRSVEGEERVRFDERARRKSAPGDHIRRAGEVVRSGGRILPAGALLTPGALSLAATHGHAELSVHRAPRVALIVTGDEVVPPETEPGPGQLRDSHGDFVHAACRGIGIAGGVEVEALGIAPDDRDRLTERVRRGLEADVLLLSGGVSMGELDLVEGVLRELGCEVLFDRVAVQPGKPLVAAQHENNAAGRGLVFGLPGNPASVMVCFWLFVRPALHRLLGRPGGFWHGALAGELAAPLPRAKARDKFLPAALRVEEGRLLVTPSRPVGSHDMGSYATGQALVRIPAHCPGLEAGAPCEVLPLADTLF
jgi:molybdopterin molybdotransferase